MAFLCGGSEMGCENLETKKESWTRLGTTDLVTVCSNSHMFSALRVLSEGTTPSNF